MSILDELREDHVKLLGELSALAAGPAEAERVARFVRDLVGHAHGEDDLLFRELEKGLPADHGPLAVMREEHEEIEGRLTRIASLDPSGDEIGNQLRRLLAVAREHFLKEEEVLFEFALRLVDAERLDELGRLFRERPALSAV